MLVLPESTLLQPPTGNGSYGGDGSPVGLAGVVDPLPLVRTRSLMDHTTPAQPSHLLQPPNVQSWGFEPQTSLLLAGDGKELLFVGESQKLSLGALRKCSQGKDPHVPCLSLAPSTWQPDGNASYSQYLSVGKLRHFTQMGSRPLSAHGGWTGGLGGGGGRGQVPPPGQQQHELWMSSSG